MEEDTIGKLLRECREASGIGLREAARRMKISPATLSRIELGGNKAALTTSLGTVRKLREFYSLDARVFFE